MTRAQLLFNMIIDGLGVLALAAVTGAGFYFRMLDVILLCTAATFVFGLLWWINYGDRLRRGYL